jgi:prevent-host-death family protein
MTTIVNIHKAKTNLSELIQRAESGEEVIIARDGNPVVKMVRLARNQEKRPAPGIDAGKVVLHPDFDDPLPEFDPE